MNGQCGTERAAPELRLGVVLAVILTLKLATLGSFAAGWYAGPFDASYLGHLYVPAGHKYAQTQKIQQNPFERLALFDGQWYREIAHEGYTLERADRMGWSSYAFFPAFPVLSAALGKLFGGPLIAGLVVNQVLSVLSGLLLFLLARRSLGDDRGALLAVLCFYLYPTAGFLNVFYAESLFVFLVVAHLLLFERGRDRAAAVAGVLAGLCRPQGVLLVFWHLGRLAEGSGSLKRCALGASSPVLGFTLFWAYISARTRSATSLFELQSTWGRRGDLAGVVHDLAESLESFGGWLLVVSLMLAGLALLLAPRAMWAWRETSGETAGIAAWTLLSLAMIAVPLVTGSATSVPRFLLANVPQYLVLGAALRHHPVLQLAAFCFLAALQGFANVHIVNWRWIA